MGFSCLCDESVFHQATISNNGKMWICSRNDKIYGKLKSNQTVWLDNTVRSSESEPTIRELHLIEHEGKQIRIINRIAARWETVAALLDFHYSTIEAIRSNSYYPQTHSGCQLMFERCLKGEGFRPKTWQTLIKALDGAEFSTLAQEIREALVN